MGIALPEYCLRNLNDCEPLSQIKSDCGESFICCGYNNGKTRVFDEDRFRVCWKNKSINEISDWDKRDIIDTISILSGALSVDINRLNNQE